MAIDGKKLNIVDESGEIVGTATREEIHKNGLLHREIHVWFYTPNGEFIFQHRAKDKDTYPNLLDATVGGHVEIDKDYLAAALAETEEETGLKIEPRDLTFITMIRSRSEDSVTGMINNRLAAEYAFCFRGEVHNLVIEPGKAEGFEVWQFNRFFNATPEERKRFIPSLFSEQVFSVLNEIKILWEKGI